MGIHGLSKLIADNAPKAIKEHKFETFFSRTIAIDASMSLYQFMTAIRRDGEVLTNDKGEVTSHLQGLLHRTTRLLASGIKPVYVFDGKPPTMKSGELAKRRERSAEAREKLLKANEEGNAEDVEKYAKRVVRVTSQDNEDARRLLTCMGVPFVVASCEAEATCASLCKDGKVFATATEDMDALTFGTTLLLRNLTAPASKNLPIMEFSFERVLEGLELSHDEFIDLCILCGCDYCDKIPGIGPVRALKLIKAHHSIEGILEALDPEKYPAPKDWPYEEARRLFKEPDVTQSENVSFVWKGPNETELIKFLVDEKGFSETAVKSATEKMRAARKKGGQKRIESFFKPIPKKMAS